MGNYKIIFIAILILLGSIRYAYSATATQTSNVTLNVPDSAKLEIAYSNATKTLAQGSDTEAAFDNGFVDFDAATPTLTVSANKRWKLYGRSSLFTGPYSKSVSDLMLKDTGASHVTSPFSNFTSLSTSDQEIASYTGPIKKENHPIQYRIILDWTKDIAGTYTATVTYTLATQA